MIDVLYPRLPIGADETPTSYVSRLAQLHKADYARMFAKDMELNFRKIVDGDDDELAVLAKLTGTPVETLIANAITACGGVWRLRGQTLLKTSMQRTAPRVCPSCIAADIALANRKPELLAYGRSTWEIASIRTCPIHRVPITQAAQPRHATYAHDFASTVGMNATQIAASARPHRDPSSFETYLLNRLNGLAGPAWLDALAFSAAARTCEVIGAVALRGRSPKMAHMTDDDWWAAASVGFEIAQDGESAIRTWLSDLQRTYRYSRSGTEGPQAVFGAFYKWLAFQAKDPIFEPIRDLVRRHIIETMPIGSQETVFGVAVERRRLHSIYTASLEYAIHPKRLRKILAAAGVIGPETENVNDNRVLFDAARAQIFLVQEADGISLQEAETYLNAGRVHAKLLANHGLIRPMDTSHEKGKTGIHARFAKRDLDIFLGRLTRDAKTIKFPSPKFVTIPAAAKRANCSAIEIVRLILDRKLAFVGKLVDQAGYLSIHVDLDEIKKCVQGAPLDGLTARQLEHELKTSTKVVTALVANSHFRPLRTINPINRCPVQTVPREQVEEFKATYVSLTNLADERGVHFRKLAAELHAAGVKPTLDRETYGATFYRRADIDGRLGTSSTPQDQDRAARDRA